MDHPRWRLCAPRLWFYRARGRTTSQAGDAEAKVRCVAVKLRWEDNVAVSPRSISAVYTSVLVEMVSTVVLDQPINGRWLLLLKQVNGENRLIYQLDPGSGTTKDCQDLANKGIN